MKLEHFKSKPIEFDRTRTYTRENEGILLLTLQHLDRHSSPSMERNSQWRDHPPVRMSDVFAAVIAERDALRAIINETLESDAYAEWGIPPTTRRILSRATTTEKGTNA